MKVVGGGELADSPAQENLGSGLRLGAGHLYRLAAHALAPLLLPRMDGRPSLSCALDFRMQGNVQSQLCFCALAVSARGLTVTMAVQRCSHPPGAGLVSLSLVQW